MIPVTNHLPPLSLLKTAWGWQDNKFWNIISDENSQICYPKVPKKSAQNTVLYFSKTPPATPQLREILSTDGKSWLMPWVVGRGYGTDDGYQVIKVHGTFFLNWFAGLCGHGYALRGFWGVAPHSHVRHSVHRHLGFVPLLLWAAHKTTAHYLTATDWCMIGCLHPLNRDGHIRVKLSAAIIITDHSYTALLFK